MGCLHATNNEVLRDARKISGECLALQSAIRRENPGLGLLKMNCTCASCGKTFMDAYQRYMDRFWGSGITGEWRQAG